MKERNNTSRIFDRVWAVIAALVALLLLFCKMSGQLAWSWPVSNSSKCSRNSSRKEASP